MDARGLWRSLVCWLTAIVAAGGCLVRFSGTEEADAGWDVRRPTCGDGLAEGEELCDGSDLRGQTCRDLGFGAGELTCRADCMHFDTDNCFTCGDGVLQAAEACERTSTCRDIGLDGDARICSDDCLMLDPSPCWKCGNGECQAERGEGPSSCPEDCGEPVVALACGRAHTCVVAEDGRVFCWGANERGQLGDGTTDDRAWPAPVQDLSGVAAVTCGSAFACAVDGTGSMYCWGANGSGQLGDGTTEDRLVPVRVSMAGVVDGDGGYNHTCALDVANMLWCWGANRSGELGIGSRENRAWPVRGELDQVRLVQAGGASSCAVTIPGMAYCWGANDHGQVGIGTLWDALEPCQVAGFGESVRHLDVGRDHVCAVGQDTGAVWCWGSNSVGQLGVGEQVADAAVPARVSGLEAMVGVAAGWAHSCAWDDAGGAWCWGKNQWGTLGDGTYESQWIPVPVEGLSGRVVDMCAGMNHTCALTEQGAVWCWGANNRGQLGTQVDGNPGRPVQVPVFGWGRD